MDIDDEDAPMPSHIHSAQSLHDEIERRKRSRERRAQAAHVAIPPEPMPPGRGDVTIQLSGIEVRAEAGTLRATLSAVSSVAPPVQQTSIKNLEPVFRKLTNLEVQVYAKDDQPIGPRIGVADVPEPTLKAIAGVEVERRGRISDRSWYVVGGLLLAIATGVGGWIAAKMTGG